MEQDAKYISPEQYKKRLMMDLSGLTIDDAFFFEGNLIEKLLLTREIMKNKIKYDAKTYENIYAYGYNLFSAGQYGKAKDVFKVLLLLEPKKIKGYIALGGALQKMQHLDKALHVYQGGYLVDPVNVTVLLNIGLCHMALEDYEKAEQALLLTCLTAHKDKDTDPEKKFKLAENLWKTARQKQQKETIALKESLIHVD